MIKTNIIQRRDLEPLWNKATEVRQHYEKASNSITAVVGADQIKVQHSDHPKAMLFCSLCKRYYHDGAKLAPHETPCSKMHCDAMQEARKQGGSYMYKCPVGFIFWTSPFFAAERFAGALITSGFLAAERQQIIDKLFNIWKTEIPHSEIAEYLDDLPGRTNEEIKALAQMMLLCAEQISLRESTVDDSNEYADKKPNLMEQERSLIAHLRRGDNAEAHAIVRELLSALNTASNGNFERFKLDVIELVVMLSRTGANSDDNGELVEANNRYLKRIEDSSTVEEVADNLYLITEWMAGKIFSFQGVRHASALRKAERFIRENYTRKISLKEVSNISGLSSPYFSTIFKEEMGENLSTYLNRLRVEKASSMLRETDSPISGISAACGFEDQSWFSKIFKNYTGFSPCKFREHGGL